MRFIKRKPDELNFNDVVMDLIKKSRDEENGKGEIQYLISHGNVKYVVTIEINGRKAVQKLGECDYITAP